MRDKVNSVRLAAAEALCLTGLVRAAPAGASEAPVANWSEAIVIPQLYNLMQRPGSRERQLALGMIQIIVSLGAVEPDVTIGVLVPLLLNASQDVVSNVRLAVAKTLDFFMRSEQELVAVLAGHVELQRCLERLSGDEDYDVHLHARQAMSTFSALAGPGSESQVSPPAPSKIETDRPEKDAGAEDSEGTSGPGPAAGSDGEPASDGALE